VLSQVRGHSTSYARCVVTALRAYLRFLASQGYCPAGLDRAIPTIPQWRLSSLPRYLPADEIERVVATCDITTPLGMRDRAVLLLLVRLGLRAGDVVKLRLTDIDWHAATIKVCGKGRRQVRLPLPQDAGDAVLAYLKHTRPQVAIDRVFLCLRAPHRYADRMTDPELKVTDRRWWARGESASADTERQSLKPTYIEELEARLAAKDLELQHVLPRLEQGGMRSITAHRVERAERSTTLLEPVAGGSVRVVPAVDAIVYSVLRVPANNLWLDLRDRRTGVYCIGDAASPRTTAAVIHEGEELARSL